jgi:hypothetical protein
MTNEEVLLEKYKNLTPDLKKEALNVVEYLQSKLTIKEKRKSSFGILSEFDLKISKEDTDEMRRETWANFPRKSFCQNK